MYRNQTNQALLLKSIILVVITVCLCAIFYYDYSVRQELKSEVADAEAASQNWEVYSRQIDNWYKAQQASIDALKDWVNKAQQSSSENFVQGNTPIFWALPLCQNQKLTISQASKPNMLQNQIFDKFSSNQGVK